MKAFILMLSILSLNCFATGKFNMYSFTHFPQMSEISSFIMKVNPKLDSKIKDQVTTAILKASLESNIDYRLMMSIIAVESTFKPNSKSATGDFSIVQINFKTWNNEFKRIKRPAINFKRLNSDIDYSIDLMAEILVLLKTNYEHKDSIWFARYHSKTPSLKKVYFKRLMSKNAISSNTSNLIATVR